MAALASMSPDQPFVDGWQREELARCGAQREVPLVTREILQQLQSLGSVEAAKQTSIERTVEARNPPELARSRPFS